jgi:cytoskeletal protein CcmA (bactofilin family)
MFNQKKVEGDQNMENAETIVGNDVVIKGNLKSPSNIIVNGVVKGKVTTETDANIGESATIEGSVTGKNVTVAGEVQGNVSSKESLKIQSTGRIFGDVATPNLVIEEGATFVGKCDMPAEMTESSDQLDENQEEEEIEEILETEEVEEDN